MTESMQEGSYINKNELSVRSDKEHRRVWKGIFKTEKMGHEEKSILFALAVSIICLSTVLRVHAFPVRSATSQKGKLEA